MKPEKCCVAFNRDAHKLIFTNFKTVGHEFSINGSVGELWTNTFEQCRIKVDAIDASVLGPFKK